MSLLNRPIFASAIGWVSRVGAAILGILTTRIILLKLGAHDFGLIALLAGVSGWMCLIEFGFSANIQNRIARKIGLGRSTDYLRSFCHKLTLVSLPFAFVISGIVAVFLVQIGWVNYAGFLQVWIACLGVSLTAVAQMLLRIDLSMGRRVFFNIVPVVISFLVFCLVCILNSSSRGWGVGLYLVCMQLVPGGVLVLYLLFMRSSLKRMQFYYFKKTFFLLIPGSSRFALTTLLGLLVLQIDYLVISRFLEPSDAAKYNLVMKVFGVVGMMNAVALNTMWPIITESFHRRDFIGALRKGRQLTCLGLCLIFLSIVALIFSRDFVFGDIFKMTASQRPDLFLIISVGFYWLMRVWTDVYSVFIQAIDMPRSLVLPILTQAVVGIVIMFFFIPWFGISGIPLSLGLGFMLTVGWYLPIKVRNIVKN